MAKRVRVNTTQSHGNILRNVQEENDGWLRMFSPPQRKKAYQFSFREALVAWRQEFLWRRVNAASVKSAPFNYPLGGRTPMIGPNKGDRKLINVIGTGSITVSVPPATRETSPLSISGSVSFPAGHPVPPEIRAVFATVPPDEIRWIARKWQAQLSAIRTGARTISRGVNAGRLRLSPEQMEAISSGSANRPVTGSLTRRGGR